MSSVFCATHNFIALFDASMRSYSETAPFDASFNDFNIVSELSPIDCDNWSNDFFTGSMSIACFTMTVHNQTSAVVAIHEYFFTFFKLSSNFFEFFEISSNDFDAWSFAFTIISRTFDEDIPYFLIDKDFLFFLSAFASDHHFNNIKSMIDFGVFKYSSCVRWYFSMNKISMISGSFELIFQVLFNLSNSKVNLSFFFRQFMTLSFAIHQ